MSHLTADDDSSIQKTPTSSAEIIGHNEDILTNILLHLPRKQLISFKLVSEQWRLLISSPRFLNRYTLLHPPSLSGLLLVPKVHSNNDGNQMEYVSLTQNRPNIRFLPLFNIRNISLLQSCNGLLLCSRGKKHYVLNPTTENFNPKTEKLILLPRCPDQMISQCGLEWKFSPNSSPYYCLAFDATISSHYKIICVRNTRRDHYKIAIYSSESKLWRPSKAPEFSAPRDIDFASGIYCNGAVHWTKRASRGLYFDVEKELLNQMPELPRKEHYSCEYIGHSRGHLYCVFTTEGLHYYEIFEMERDYSSWFFKSKIELDGLAYKFPKMAKEINYDNPRFKYQCHVLSVVRGRRGKIVKIIMSIPGEIIAYNCKKRTSWKICNSRLGAKDRRLWYGIYHVTEYFETLSSPVSLVSL